jgi:hypothetical protein
MPTLDLTDDEKAALVGHLRHALEYDPFPYAPRLDPLKAILSKLDPLKPRPELLPQLKAGMTPRRRLRLGNQRQQGTERVDSVCLRGPNYPIIAKNLERRRGRKSQCPDKPTGASLPGSYS